MPLARAEQIPSHTRYALGICGVSSASPFWEDRRKWITGEKSTSRPLGHDKGANRPDAGKDWQWVLAK